MARRTKPTCPLCKELLEALEVLGFVLAVLARTPACTKYTTISREPGCRVVMEKSKNAKRQPRTYFF